MKIQEIYNAIDAFAPFHTAADWDNSGILIGDPDAQTDSVFCCLDVTPQAVARAKELGAGCIVSHHPIIFRAPRAIGFGSAVAAALRAEIAVISAHTNLDKAPGGVNDTLCELLGMRYEKCGEAVADGFLNVGTLSGVTSSRVFAELLQSKLGGAVRCGNANDAVTRIAVCAGAGADFFREAVALGCDAYLTGDADHHEFLDAAAYGLNLFAAGHYETEAPVVPVLCEKLRSAFPGAAVCADEPGSPFTAFVK